ncbi:hypothetical protein PRVXT_000757 [Proteinivorax tanatarense]|uniref:Uncharacterized protein n=1 Tax=Proteinivorax tanatarense TaxID=1260629 RepID=A0AAU7VNT4_9FIRM
MKLEIYFTNEVAQYIKETKLHSSHNIIDNGNDDGSTWAVGNYKLDYKMQKC